MFGGKGGLGGLMKQAQQMQEKMQKMQEEIAQLEVTGESGAGLVKVTINGAHNCRRVEIDPSLLEDDKEMLEDLVAAAFPFSTLSRQPGILLVITGRPVAAASRRLRLIRLT